MKIVITGTTSGIGKALALYYAQPGVTLGLIGRRQTLLTTTATACIARGATVVPAALDVRDGAAMSAYAEQFVRQTQGIDLVIANAGVGEPDDLRSGNAAYHADIFAVNVIGLLNTLLPFIPQMIRQKSGQLVAIASVAGFRPCWLNDVCGNEGRRACPDGRIWLGTPTSRHHHNHDQSGLCRPEMTAHNQFRMPFLVPTDIAAGKIARAIQRRQRSYTFPWPMACLAHLLPFIPGAILGRLTPPGRPSSV